MENKSSNLQKLTLEILSCLCCLQSLNLIGGSIFSKTRNYQKNIVHIIYKHPLFLCVCWLKKTKSDLMMFLFCFVLFCFFLPILWGIVIVVNIKIIYFLSFLFTFPWRPYGPGPKQITKVRKRIFSTVLVMSDAQTLKIDHCVNHAVPVSV